MDKITIIGASSIAIATIGFLLIQFTLDNRIKNSRDGNIELVSGQKETVNWIEKANSYREIAQSTANTIHIMTAVGIKKDVSQKAEDLYISYLKASVMYTINALAASKEISNDESETLINQTDTLSKEALIISYVTYAKQAANATFTLGDKIKNNKKNILRLEKLKNIYFYFCFAFQSIGLILGLISISLKKITSNHLLQRTDKSRR